MPRKAHSSIDNPSVESLARWREGYRQHLIGKGASPAAATEIALKVPYRSDLYPEPGEIQSFRKIPSNNMDHDNPRDTREAPPEPSSNSKSAKLQRLLVAAAQIAEGPPQGKNIVFQHSVMCQLGLPRSACDGPSFQRQCGNKSLLISAGSLWDGDQFVPQTVPYGPMPRLIIPWINSEALRHRSLDVALGRSAKQFLALLGKDTSGGLKGGYTSLRKQMLAFVASRITLGENAKEKAITLDGSPFHKTEAWQPKEGQPLQWPNAVTLSESYFSELAMHAVPLDWRALQALKGSALAMDIYMMLSERLHRTTGSTKISWYSVYEQFGQEYAGKDPHGNFKRAFKLALRDVLLVYPAARVKVEFGGILLLPSPPPVPYR